MGITLEAKVGIVSLVLLIVGLFTWFIGNDLLCGICISIGIILGTISILFMEV